MRPQDHDRPNNAAVILLSGPIIWGFVKSGPLMVHGQVQLLPTILGFLAALCVLQLFCFSFEIIARLIDWRRANAPTGMKGRARFAKWEDIKDELD